MKVLAIDTAAGLCSACVWDAAAGAELGREVLVIGKGHAEALMGVVAAALERSRSAYADLGGIAVCVGPGSFTGVRIGVATARGLALALRIPAVGVTTLEAVAFEARGRFAGRAVFAALDAGRGELYVAAYDADGDCTAAPAIADAGRAARMAADADAVLTGSASRIVMAAAGRRLDIAGEERTADVAVYARLAALRGFSGKPPKPLYLRGADARPQQGFALPRRAAP